MSSDDIAVSARGLCKVYQITSAAGAPTTFGEHLARRARHPFHRMQKEALWALNDVSFDIKAGEVVGLIGRNGAGKTTALKILSRITEPSDGVVHLHGRVGSLLEVGTGFHPELTGRENIFLNGAILGMRRREIARQMDAIVEFSGVGRFLDMPVKRYSSGMSVRLAFAVAAHLEPEILIIDEVLAVGDAEFQRKCLGKMSEVASIDARTVLFVSHNLSAIETLCTRCIYLDAGRVQFDGTPREAIAAYMSASPDVSTAARPGDHDLRHRGDNSQYPRAILQRVRLLATGSEPIDSVPMGERITVVVDVEALSELTDAVVGFDLRSDLEQTVATFHTHMKAPLRATARHDLEQVEFRLGALPLLPGRYWLDVGVWDPVQNRLADRVNRAIGFDVVASNVYNSPYQATASDGLLYVDFEWKIGPSEDSAFGLVPVLGETD